MSENVTQPRQATEQQGSEGDVRRMTPLRSDPSRRVDQPHGDVAPGIDQHDRGPVAETPREPAMPTAVDSPGDDVRKATLMPTEDELLLQASQIAEHLRTRFAELDRREQTLNAQSAEFDQDRRSFRFRARQVEEELNERESKLAVREAELTQRLNACEQLTTETRLQRQRLLEQRQALEAERVEMRKTLAADLDKERRQFDQDKEGWERQRNTELAELERKRQINDVSIRESQQQLAAHRQRQLQQIERQQKKLEQEQTLHQKRMHFQEAHLKKTRQDLETVRNALRLERQQHKDRSVQQEAMLRMRRLQLDHYRALLEQRVLSVRRERELLEKCRLAQQEETQSARRRLQLERQNWQREQQVEQDEQARRKAALAEQTESLESRTARLNELQRELDGDHRNMLEMRLSLEQAWAEFSEQAGADVTLARVEQARTDLADHFRRERESLARQRHDLQQTESRLHEEWEEFQRERRTLTEWMTERDAQLACRDQQLCEQLETLETREAAWRAAREQWQREKLQAEHVIGDLLRELTEANYPSPRKSAADGIEAVLRTTAEDPHVPLHSSPNDEPAPSTTDLSDMVRQSETDSTGPGDASAAGATVAVIDPRD